MNQDRNTSLALRFIVDGHRSAQRERQNHLQAAEEFRDLEKLIKLAEETSTVEFEPRCPESESVREARRRLFEAQINDAKRAWRKAQSEDDATVVANDCSDAAENIGEAIFNYIGGLQGDVLSFDHIKALAEKGLSSLDDFECVWVPSARAGDVRKMLQEG